MSECIFHIALADDWEGAQRFGEYEGSTRATTLDQVGFIHAATAADLELCSLDSVRRPPTSTGSGGCRSGCPPCCGGLDQVGRAQPIASWYRHAGSTGSWEHYRWIRTSSSMFSRSRKSTRNGSFPTCPHIRSEMRRGSRQKPGKPTLRLIVVRRVRSSNNFLVARYLSPVSLTAFGCDRWSTPPIHLHRRVRLPMAARTPAVAHSFRTQF